MIALPDEARAFTFTMFQHAGMPDALFDGQHASLQREFEHIRARFVQGEA